MHLRTLLVMVSTLSVLVSGMSPFLAMAETKGTLFLGTGSGLSTTNGERNEIADFLAANPAPSVVEDNENVFKGFVGYDFTPYFTAELFYAYLGRVRFDDNGASSDFESSAYGMSAVGQLPISSWLTAFAKAGVAKWDSGLEGNLNGTNFTLEGRDGTDPVYGVGAQVNFAPFLLRTEYEYYDFDNDYRIGTFTASAGFQF